MSTEPADSRGTEPTHHEAALALPLLRKEKQKARAGPGQPCPGLGLGQGHPQEASRVTRRKQPDELTLLHARGPHSGKSFSYFAVGFYKTHQCAKGERQRLQAGLHGASPFRWGTDSPTPVGLTGSSSRALGSLPPRSSDCHKGVIFPAEIETWARPPPSSHGRREKRSWGWMSHLAGADG